MLAFYVYRQLHVDTPLLELRALGIAEFRIPAIMVTCSFACTLAVMYLAPQELQRGLGLDTTVAGMLMLAGGVINAICSSVATCLLTLGQTSYEAAGGSDPAQGFVDGARYGYVFAIVLIVVVLALSFLLKERREPAAK